MSLRSRGYGSGHVAIFSDGSERFLSNVMHGSSSETRHVPAGLTVRVAEVELL